ncbi:TPA: hypothetical protein KQD98_000028 [Clostridioides difficile]|nr:hypothetical protein [Clostridioides difficile]
MKILSLFWCFILTIWNVNSNINDADIALGEGFILTIWNVNSSLDKLSDDFGLVLY